MESVRIGELHSAPKLFCEELQPFWHLLARICRIEASHFHFYLELKAIGTDGNQVLLVWHDRVNRVFVNEGEAFFHRAVSCYHCDCTSIFSFFDKYQVFEVWWFLLELDGHGATEG